MTLQLLEPSDPSSAMTERYFFVIDTGQLRTYQETTAPENNEATLVPIMGLDLPSGRTAGLAPAPTTPQNGTVPAPETSNTPALSVGSRFAAEINAFLLSRPAARWALAVPPAMETDLLAGIDAGVLKRMDTCLAARISRLSTPEIYEQFRQISAGVVS